MLSGRRVDGNGRTILRVPPILDVDTWRKLQAELDRKATKKGAVRAGSAMLVGVAVCQTCGGPMYKLRTQNVRKDGTKQFNFYYRCWGTETNPSTCKNMFPLDELDAWTEARMARIKFPRYEIVVTPGHGHEDKIYEVERDLRELDLDAPDYDERHAELRTERARLRALPSTADKVERRKTGDSIGQYWETLQTEADKRAFLLKLDVKVYVRRGATRDEDHVFLELGDGLAQGRELAPEMADTRRPMIIVSATRDAGRERGPGPGVHIADQVPHGGRLAHVGRTNGAFGLDRVVRRRRERPVWRGYFPAARAPDLVRVHGARWGERPSRLTHAGRGRAT